MHNGVDHARCELIFSKVLWICLKRVLKVIAPKFAELAASFPHVQFLRVDVDKQQTIAAKYKISAMPTFLAIVNGEVKDRVCKIRL